VAEKVQFNEKTLQGMKPSKKRIQIFDATQPGLALRITPEGIKSFSVVYKFSGRMRRFTLGKYPAVTIADARKRASDALRSVERGEDPMAKKAALRIAGTVGELTEIYMDEHSKAKKKSWRDDQRMLDAYILPVLKHTKASTVTIEDVEILLEKIAKTAPVQANRVRALLRHIFTWTLSTRKHRRAFALTMNPCAYVPRLTDETARERVYSDEELKALWKAFEAVGIVGDLFKLQLLTATRKGELTQIEWSEVDLERAVWLQPGTNTKNTKPHVVPLSIQAVRILQGLKDRQAKLKNKSKRESKFVFYSSRTGNIPMTWLQKAADRVCEESKIEDFQAHDLRRTTATRLAEAGVADPVLKMILNHSLGKDITGVYNQYKYFDERKQALQAWATRLMKIVSDLKAAVAATAEMP
jgi:integrase